MFALYYAPEGSSEWHFVGVVALAGLLVERILEEAQTKRPGVDDCMPWEISGGELKERVMQASVPLNERQGPAGYKLVIDATYSMPSSHLFEICHVWGYTDPEWSPLVLGLSGPHWSETRPRGPGTPVESFKPTDHCEIATDFVHEFLYLRHGHRGGKKAWGRVGYTNAALYSGRTTWNTFLGKSVTSGVLISAEGRKTKKQLRTDVLKPRAIRGG